METAFRIEPTAANITAFGVDAYRAQTDALPVPSNTDATKGFLNTEPSLLKSRSCLVEGI
eukprot:1086102-Amphidinium_carterae.1